MAAADPAIVQHLHGQLGIEALHLRLPLTPHVPEDSPVSPFVISIILPRSPTVEPSLRPQPLQGRSHRPMQSQTELVISNVTSVKVGAIFKEIVQTDEFCTLRNKMSSNQPVRTNQNSKAILLWERRRRTM